MQAAELTSSHRCPHQQRRHTRQSALNHRRHARRQSVKVLAGPADTLEQPSSIRSQNGALNAGIAAFYDASSSLWESMWGEHMHHGYYPKGQPPKSNAQAQVDMVEETLRWAGVSHASRVVDVGCGIGGSSRHLARRFGARTTGITLSPVQASRGTALAEQQGLGSQCSFQVADALQQPFEDGSFDLVWSMESGEHMPDKQRFVGELARVAAPGGCLIIVTWCHRDLQPGEAALKPEEQALLDRICKAYYLPAWCSISDYRRLFEAEGLQDIKTADWSDEVAPFWDAVIRSALSLQGVAGLFRAGWTTLKGALVMPLMAQGYRRGLIKFNLITARKP